MKRVLSFLLLLGLIFGLIPTKTSAATLADYRKLLKQYQDKYAESQAGINKTESEIKQTNKEIENIRTEMINLSSEIAILNEDIIRYEEEIAAKELETKKLIEYLQLSEGENVYLEYAFNADNMTDLIYRMAVVEQITKYNDESINNANDLIKKSEKRQKEINTKEKQLKEKEKKLERLVVSLGEDISSLTESGVSATKQIELYKKQIKMYEDLNCGEHDVIGKDCAVIGSIGNWRKPTKTGYITSEYGMRTLDGITSLHRGIDISSSNPYQTKIYSIGNGIVLNKYEDNNHALCVITEHKDTKKNKTYTATYCHLSSYNPKLKEGMSVTTDTWLGYMGCTGYCKGPHLHFEIIDCKKLYGPDPLCGDWDDYVKYAKKRYNEGFKGPRGFITFPKKYVKWTSR